MRVTKKHSNILENKKLAISAVFQVDKLKGQIIILVDIDKKETNIAWLPKATKTATRHWKIEVTVQTKPCWNQTFKGGGGVKMKIFCLFF